MMGTSPSAPWFVNFQPRRHAMLRLFCFPYAGGSAGIFRQWAQNVPFEVIAVEYPGRGSRRAEPPATSICTLADRIAPAIRQYLDKPFAFFGHSMGALVSFEVLHRLKVAGAPDPTSFFVSGCRAPRLMGERKPIHGLPEPQFVEELRSLGGTPEEVLADSELLRLLMPTLRADFEASETYSCGTGPRIRCPTFAYGGMQDLEVLQDDLEAWRDECDSAFRLRVFPGGHFFVHTAEDTLLRVLSRDLLTGADKNVSRL